jgi:histone H3
MARTKQIERERKQNLLGNLKRAEGDGAKKTRTFKKWRAGTVASRDVKKAMRQVHPLIPRSQVFAIAREVVQDLGKSMRFQNSAVDALREAITAFGVDFMSYSNKVRMVVGKDKTLLAKHSQIGRALMSVPCLSDTSEPMYKKLGKPSKKEGRAEPAE